MDFSDVKAKVKEMIARAAVERSTNPERFTFWIEPSPKTDRWNMVLLFQGKTVAHSQSQDFEAGFTEVYSKVMTG